MAGSSGRLVNSLRDRGHTVHVIHLTRNPGQTLAATQKQVLGNAVLDNWNRVLTTGINAPLEPEHLFWRCRNMMVDSILIGFGGDQPGYLATLWAKWLELKSFVLFRGNDFERVIHDAKRAWITHFVLSHADIVGAVSQEMTARIRTLRSECTVYTPNGIDTAEWTFFESDLSKAKVWREQNVPDGKPVAGIIGQLKSKKGLHLALTLLASPEFQEKAHLLTVGNIPENIVQAQDVPENWVRVPFQQREQLPVFYAAADIVFIPSIYDGMPNVLLEAMALGKTVVASKAGGIPDVITDGVNGFLFEIDDASSVVKAFDTALLMSQEERSRIEVNARKTIEEHFTPAQEVERIEAELLSIH
ncbi:MAG: glycosyltransferase family 4 protein [Gammaproteobacteria bacterium]|nr:glycosyltransferase family 4 protein [Gammaproteobacteria bacterium]